MTTRIACAGISGRILQGRVSADRLSFTGQTKDVTSDVLAAVIDKLKHHGGSFTINCDGKPIATLTLSAPTEQQQGGEAVATDAFVPGSLADLLFQLGEKGIWVSGGTHGEHWRVAPLYTHPADQVAEPDAELVRQCIAQELATWEGDFKGPVHTAMRCLQVRIDAKLASLKGVEE